jgi:hypothetical protein
MLGPENDPTDFGGVRLAHRFNFLSGGFCLLWLSSFCVLYVPINQADM